VNNSNLHPISHRFQDSAEYWSNFRCRQCVPLFNALVIGESPTFRSTKFSAKKTRNILSYGTKYIFKSWTVKRRDSRVLRTDITMINAALNYMCVAQPKILQGNYSVSSRPLERAPNGAVGFGGTLQASSAGFQQSPDGLSVFLHSSQSIASTVYVIVHCKSTFTYLLTYWHLTLFFLVSDLCLTGLDSCGLYKLNQNIFLLWELLAHHVHI